MPANAGQTLRPGSSFDDVIDVFSSSPAFPDINFIPINPILIDLTNIEALPVDSNDSSDSPIDSEAQYTSEWEGFATSSDNKAHGDQSDSESDSADEAIPSPPTGFL